MMHQLQLELSLTSNDSSGGQHSNTSIERTQEQHIIARAMSPSKGGGDAASQPVSQQQALLEQEESVARRIEERARRRRLHSLRDKEVVLLIY